MGLIRNLCCIGGNTIQSDELNSQTETKDLLVLSKDGDHDFLFDTQSKERKPLNKSRVFGLEHPTIACANKRVFLFGGGVESDGTQLGSNKAESLDFNTHVTQWRKGKELPYKGMLMSSAYYHGGIYLIGGVNGMENGKPGTQNFIKNIYVYNILKKKWLKLGEIETPRMQHNSVACNGKIYTVGGIDQTLKYTNKVESYDITMNVSSTITVLPKLVSSIGVAELNGVIFVLGGKCDGAEPDSLRRVFLKFDSTSLLWEDVIGQSNYSKSSTSVCVVGGRVVTVGGLEDKPVVVETFDLLRRKWDCDKGYLESDKWTNQQVVAL